MAEPDEPTTTVNVKNMPVAAWRRAGDRARANDETLGQWLSRAIHQLADREAGTGRVIPPARPATPEQPRQTAEEMAAAAQLLAAMAATLQAMTAAASAGMPPARRHVAQISAAAASVARTGALPAIRRATPGRLVGYSGEGEP